MLELLSAKCVQSFESIRKEEVENLIEAILLTPPQVPIDISKMIFSMTNNITARTAFGKKCKHKDEFIEAMKTIIELSGGLNIPDLFPSLKIFHSLSGAKPALEKVHKKVDKILEDIIEEHKANKREMSSHMLHKEDLVDVLLRIQESGDLEIPISRNTLKSVILVRLFKLIISFSKRENGQNISTTFSTKLSGVRYSTLTITNYLSNTPKLSVVSRSYLNYHHMLGVLVCKTLYGTSYYCLSQLES